MPSFTPLHIPQEPQRQDGWEKADTFTSKGRVITDKSGREYKIIYKHEQEYSGGMRFLRGAFAFGLTVITGCIALAFKPVRDLYTKQSQTIRYAIPMDDIKRLTEDSNQPIKEKINYIANYLPYFKLEEPQIVKTVVQESLNKGGPIAHTAEIILKTKNVTVEGHPLYDDALLEKAADQLVTVAFAPTHNSIPNTYGSGIRSSTLQPFWPFITKNLEHYDKNEATQACRALLNDPQTSDEESVIRASAYLLNAKETQVSVGVHKAGHVALLNLSKFSPVALITYVGNLLQVVSNGGYIPREAEGNVGLALHYISTHQNDFDTNDKLLASAVVLESYTYLKLKPKALQTARELMFAPDAHSFRTMSVIPLTCTHFSTDEWQKANTFLRNQLDSPATVFKALGVIGAIMAKRPDFSSDLQLYASNKIITFLKNGTLTTCPNYYDEFIVGNINAFSNEDQEFIVTYFASNRMTSSLAKLLLDNPEAFPKDIYAKALTYALNHRHAFDTKTLTSSVTHALTNSKDQKLLLACLEHLYIHFNQFDDDTKQVAEKLILDKNFPLNLNSLHWQFLSQLTRNIKDKEQLLLKCQDQIGTGTSIQKEFLENILKSCHSLPMLLILIAYDKNVAMSFEFRRNAAKKLIQLLKADSLLDEAATKDVYKLARFIFEHPAQFTTQELKQAAILFLERGDENPKLVLELVLVIREVIVKAAQYAKTAQGEVVLTRAAQVRYETVSQSQVKATQKVYLKKYAGQ